MCVCVCVSTVYAYSVKQPEEKQIKWKGIWCKNLGGCFHAFVVTCFSWKSVYKVLKPVTFWPILNVADRWNVY